MSNHYHVIVETPQANLSAGMRQLNGVYTQRFNRRHERVGHVFQGRFKGILVERDAYLLELARYVVLNPARARMVKQVGQWPWSSYRAMIGQETPPPWLEIDWVLGQFARRRSLAIERYADFVAQGISAPGVWEELKGQIFLGSDSFVERMQAQIGAEVLREVPRAQRRRPPPPLARFA